MVDLENERDMLKKEIHSLKEDVKCIDDDFIADTRQDAKESRNEAIKTDAACGKETMQTQHSTKTLTTEDLVKADSGINIDFINEVKNEIYHNMDAIIEQKISETVIKRKHYKPMERSNPSNSFSSQRTYPGKIGKMRDQNIIIHGIYEGDGDDRLYLTKLFDFLGMDHTGLLAAHRLGIKKSDRQRPLRVTMKTLEDKEELMSRLGLLWNAENDLKKMSVTDDYTIAEREEIRRWVTMAKEKTTNETSGYVWKARGTPKTGMRLIRIKQQR